MLFNIADTIFSLIDCAMRFGKKPKDKPRVMRWCWRGVDSKTSRRVGNIHIARDIVSLRSQAQACRRDNCAVGATPTFVRRLWNCDLLICIARNSDDDSANYIRWSRVWASLHRGRFTVRQRHWGILTRSRETAKIIGLPRSRQSRCHCSEPARLQSAIWNQ